MKTKKDFIKEALKIAGVQDPKKREKAIRDYLPKAKASNPRFDEGIFRNYVNKKSTKKKVSDTLRYSKKMKYVKTDAWRGYEEPVYAVAGVNDTGMWSDSPSPSNVTGGELKDFQKELKQMGVPTKVVTGKTSNVFAVNNYLVAPTEIYPDAKSKVKKVLPEKEVGECMGGLNGALSNRTSGHRSFN